MAKLATLCALLLLLGACAHQQTPPTASPAVVSAPPAPRLRYSCFQGEQLGGLVFRVNQISAYSTLSSVDDGDGSCTPDRRVQLTGTVVEPTGALGFRVTRFLLDELTDQDGRDLIGAGNADIQPREGRGNTLQRPSSHPGSPISQGFSAQVSGLASLPTVLSSVRGRVYAEVPGMVQDVEIDLDSSTQTEPVPGLKVRIRRYREDRGYVSAQLEYTLDRQAMPQGQAPPIVLSAAVLNEERQVVRENITPNEYYARTRSRAFCPSACP